MTIKHIRSAIFGLSEGPGSDGLRNRAASLLRAASTVSGFQPRMFFDGPIDTTVPDTIAADLLATMGEALTNVARHAEATRVDVSITVTDEVVLTVADDGIGPPAGRGTVGRGVEQHGGREPSVTPGRCNSAPDGKAAPS